MCSARLRRASGGSGASGPKRGITRASQRAVARSAATTTVHASVQIHSPRRGRSKRSSVRTPAGAAPREARSHANSAWSGRPILSLVANPKDCRTVTSPRPDATDNATVRARTDTEASGSRRSRSKSAMDEGISTRRGCGAPGQSNFLAGPTESSRGALAGFPVPAGGAARRIWKASSSGSRVPAISACTTRWPPWSTQSCTARTLRGLM